MTETSKPKSKLISRLIAFGLAIVLAYFGGKIIGKKFAEYQNAADAAQEE